MATLAEGFYIGIDQVNAKIVRLQQIWNINEPEKQSLNLNELLSEDQLAKIDEFDRIQLEGVIAICRQSKSMVDARRRLFTVSRT